MHPLFTLPMMTFGAALVVVLVGFAWFLRRSSNRDAADRALVGDGRPAPANVTHGALPEIAGVTALLVFVMVLLAIGYGQQGL